MSLLDKIENENPTNEKDKIHYMYYCPGCKHHHVYDGRWKFNGNMEKPSFTPSMKTWHPVYRDGKEVGQQDICHHYVEDGNIRYLSDCDHKLAGKTVPMVDLDKD